MSLGETMTDANDHYGFQLPDELIMLRDQRGE